MAARGQPCPALLLLASACGYFTSGCARSLLGGLCFSPLFNWVVVRSLTVKEIRFLVEKLCVFSPALSPDSLLWFCSFSERCSVIIS